MNLAPEWLLSAIDDGTGHKSAGRLIAIAIAGTCVCLPSLVWAFLSLLSGHLIDIPGSFIGFMSAAGTLAGALYAITKVHE